MMMPMPARSHHIAASGVAKALADKGHDVTYVSGLDKGNKINPANNKVICIGNPFESIISAYQEKQLSNFWVDEKSPLESLLFLMEWGVQLVNKTMSNPEVIAEISKPGQKYDLVIIEAFVFQESFVGLGHQFDVPVVALNPFGTCQWINDIMGNPVNPAWVPSPFLGFSDHMSFTQRAINTMMHAASDLVYNYYYMPQQEAVLQEFWPGAPALQGLLRTKIGLTLVNNHFTLSYPMPMSPSVVEIGGLHIPEKPKPLPKDLKDFLDASKEGVVYFSMGSNLRTQDMPKVQAEAILGALGALKERVLLKWDGPTPKNLSPNIRVIEWAPQGDLLAHPNIRLFVTHGGLLSTQESVFHGVPLVGIPMFGDQQFNMLLAVQKGFCVKVDFKTMTRTTMDEALREVLQKPKYKEAATRLSRLFRSKPLRPAESAVFAVEHILEHGADHLRPSSVGMPLYQVLLLDVILVALAPFLVVLLCCRALCCRKRSGGATSRAKKNN
ncbi:hypothetical protein ONE63_006023 [Megalurothrips usitatus]|uniref:UDP-glucuronosyltransferase n=1 Tax=Megalurothrips usitatus TaxID=439358 RepID=A0AAV7XS22_9NEOP|nr:hypothetical protein ONE63_006023 [Megalurothrips usitatus]